MDVDGMSWVMPMVLLEGRVVDSVVGYLVGN